MLFPGNQLCCCNSLPADPCQYCKWVWDATAEIWVLDGSTVPSGKCCRYPAYPFRRAVDSVIYDQVDGVYDGEEYVWPCYNHCSTTTGNIIDGTCDCGAWEVIGLRREMLDAVNAFRTDPSGYWLGLFSSIPGGSTPPTAYDPSFDYMIQRYGDLDSDDTNAIADYLDWLGASSAAVWNWEIWYAAALHNQKIIDYTYTYNTPSHQYPNEPALGDRITSAGYTGWTSVYEELMDRGDTIEHIMGRVLLYGGPYGGFSGYTWTGTGATPYVDITPPYMLQGDDIGIALQVETDPDTRVGPGVCTINLASGGTSTNDCGGQT